MPLAVPPCPSRAVLAPPEPAGYCIELLVSFSFSLRNPLVVSFSFSLSLSFSQPSMFSLAAWVRLLLRVSGLMNAILAFLVFLHVYV